MTGPYIVVLAGAVLVMGSLLGLHLFVVRPRRGRALRSLALERRGVYARGRAVLPVQGGEAEVGPRHLSVPCEGPVELFLFARSEHPGEPLRLGARELSLAPGQAGQVLPHFAERIGPVRVVELRDGRLHLSGYEAARHDVGALLRLGLDMARALERPPSELWPELRDELRLLADPRCLAGSVQGLGVELAVQPEQVHITVRGRFGPLEVRRRGASNVELSNPVLGLALSVRSEDPPAARRALEREGLTHPLLELVLEHDGAVLPDRIEVPCHDFGEAAVRQRLDGALRVARLLSA